MINLLPPNDKRQIRAGKANVLLLRYSIASLLLAVPLFGLVTGVYVLMDNSRKNAESVIEESSTKINQYQKTKLQHTEFQRNLKIAKEVLNKEIRYSRVVVAIAKALPNSICLDRLELDSSLFGSPIQIAASGSNYNDAIAFKTQLQNEEKIFEDVHLVRASMEDPSSSESSSDQIDAPPCNPDRTVSITISVTVKPEVSQL